MANNSIQTRFTELNYATKQDVIHELKTPLVDSFWKMIVTYRSEFAKPLGVYEIDRSPITYCLCPAIANKIDEGESRLYSLTSKYEAISNEVNDKIVYRNNSLIAILKEVAKKNNLETDDNYLRMVISNNITNNDKSFRAINNYYSCLKLLNSDLSKSIDEDLFAELYSILSDNPELISLYRNSDYMSAENKVIIDRFYTAAPANLISNLMNDYIKVVNSDQLPLVVKASLAYYFIDYIKPFPSFNEEMALLITKYVIAKSDVGEASYYLNLERLFSDLNEKVQKICIEVQKNNDFTYFLDIYVKLLNDSIDKEVARLNNLEALSLKKEYYKEAVEEAKQSPIYQESIAESEEEQTTDIEETPVSVEEKPAPVISQPQVERNNVSGLAISSLPPVLDEKEAQRLEEDLLETDPELKRTQAYFYARHCTMGKRYTINQFKKELGCAYETARTSMDALANLGYYRQEMVKNKKVYTPIKRN